MVEVHMLFQSDSGRSTTYLERWYQMYQQCLATMGKDPRIGRQLQRLLTDAGFDYIHHTVHRLPMGSWIEGVYMRAETLLTLPFADNTRQGKSGYSSP